MNQSINQPTSSCDWQGGLERGEKGRGRKKYPQGQTDRRDTEMGRTEQDVRGAQSRSATPRALTAQHWGVASRPGQRIMRLL